MRIIVGTIVALVVCCQGAQARDITDAEKQHCQADYKKYCGEYGLQTNALRDCMNKAGHSLSHACVDALVQAGEVSKSEVENRKKSGN